ncbi:MAG: zinc-dependent peptidase [Bacteroidota bacterium]|nr:zinc-dependent peptidase [Bacteroidota bacterium]
MDIVIVILLVIAVLILVIAVVVKKKKPQGVVPFPETYRKLLREHVDFYNALDEVKKIDFENRLQFFLSGVRITGVKTTVEEIDKVLIAAGAIIPIFGFPGWEYINLHEVLLYPGSFNNTFNQDGDDRNTLGLVGTGPYQNIMILSQYDLREGFANKTGKNNTAIHEFVHLVDKTDGAVDGIPEFLLSKQYVLPWLDLMHREIKAIMDNRSDINPYGATNTAEFFAVAAEYFFERPDLLQINHPELYSLLVTIFRQQPQKTA